VIFFINWIELNSVRRWEKMIEKKFFVEPELIKYEESLDEVTLQPIGSSDGQL
jgi:hypothetical protein